MEKTSDFDQHTKNLQNNSIMKELSIEEKAKRYDTALEIAKEYFKANQKIGDLDENDTLLGIFPELKGSEDEQIRKWIIDDIKYNMNNESLNNSEYIKKAEKAIAWLEKQSDSDETKAKVFLINKGYPIDANGVFPTYEEMCNIIREGLEQQSGQNLINGVELKFNVGDWVVNKFGDSWHIDSFDKQNYQVSDGKGNYNYFSILHQDDMRLWSIEDAKDGDVLCTYECDEPKIVFVLKGTPKKHRALRYYCYYNIMYPYFESDSETGCLAPNGKDVKPATKEQRDLLLTKIKEAGYGLNETTKELTKLKKNV